MLNTSQKEASISSPRPALAPASSLVLLIDDDGRSRHLMAPLLSTTGASTSDTCCGSDALDQLQNLEPSAILLDLTLPDTDGLDLLPHMRKLVPETPIIVVTGRTEARTAVNAMRLGAFDYLDKPIELEEFELCVQRALQHSECNAPAESAQVTRLMQKEPLGFASEAPGVGACGCKTESSRRSHGWRAAKSRNGADACTALSRYG